MMALPDIPRLYTALAEWLACMVYVLALRPRFGRGATILIGAGWLLGMGVFLQLTGHVPIVWWIPCMTAAVAAMYLLLLLACEIPALDAGYCCARAFILAEFAASLEWQIHCLLWPSRSGSHPAALLLMAVVYAAVYGFVFWFDIRRMGQRIGSIGASGRSLVSAVVMAITAFAVSNLSFAQSGSNTMSVFYIRTLVDFAGVLILSIQQEQLRESRLHEELSAMDNVLHRQYEQYRQSKENIHLLNRRYHDLKVQIAAIRAERDPGKQAAALDEMESGIRMYEAQNKTGNPVLDTLLTAKSLYCQQHEINLTCVADGHLLDFMPTTDICTIVGTALDNATESVEAIPDPEKRLIRIAVYAQNGFIMLRFENYCEALPDAPGDAGSRTGAHGGYGIKSIRATAQKYGGTVTVHSENNWFTLRVLLPETQK